MTVKRKISAVTEGDASTQWPLKKPDGEPLFRRDIQYDFLAHVFGDSSFRFTPPQYPPETQPLFPIDRMWSFAELYLDALANSTKAAKTLKDKMAESQFFAVAFGKIALLINAGRINTTVAFFSEMKTALRTYHPIPCMQIDTFTRKNLQDAPRMKTQLKGCALYDELLNPKMGPPETLKEVARRGATGKRPSTSIVGLIFLLFQDHSWVTEKYFNSEYTLLDLFCPIPVPSHLRSHVFLSLCYRYLEQPQLALQVHETGIVTDDQVITQLETGDVSHENVDLPEEVEFAKEMVEKRVAFLRSERVEETQEQGAGGDADEDVAANDDVVLESIIEGDDAELPWANTASPQHMATWTQFCQRRDQCALSPLDLAWRRIVADSEEGHDPADDSDDDVYFMPIELRTRLCGFNFTDRDRKKVVVRYKPQQHVEPVGEEV